ncbi:MAG: 2-hydroxyacyl-CoA dehydratase [Peptococcaceae bacterium]|nr:2-hydroxyacyl-CoA dehydratase [Peptococcaceae bacterium]
MKKQLWETRPLEIWGKAKALRAQWQKSINEAAEREGALLAHGNTGEFDWSVGFEDLTIIEDNPAGAMMASKSDSFSRKCRMASEIRGWGREICGYVQNCWGSQFLGYEMDGGPFPFRDLSIPFPDPCDQHLKRGQQCMDLSPIPRWGHDWPMYLGPMDPRREKAFIDHVVFNYLKIIDDIERVSGQEFDDEKLLGNLDNLSALREQALRITQLMTHTPTPIGQKDLYSFYTLGMLTKVDPAETLDFWKSLADEVQWRVDNNIAAVATERYRWMEAHPSPWHFLKYFRYMEQYGAVCIGSQYSHFIAGPIELKPDGSIGHVDLVKAPAGQPVKTREDAFRYIFTEARGYRFKDDEYCRKHTITDFAKGFHADGAVMPLWRGGVGCTLTRKEQGLRLSEIGVRVLHYEGSQPGDRTDLDEHRFLDALDTWMTTQGLEKLEN